MKRGLLALILCVPALVSLGAWKLRPRPAAAIGAAQLTQFLTGTRGEPNDAPFDNDVWYSFPFGDAYGYKATAGLAFAVIPVDGTLTNFYQTNAYGELESGETATATLRSISGGDVSSGSWADTTLSVAVSDRRGRPTSRGVRTWTRST